MCTTPPKKEPLPSPRLQKRTPPPSYLFPSELCSIDLPSFLFRISCLHIRGEATDPHLLLPPLYFPLFFRLLSSSFSPNGASGEHTHTDGGGGGLTHADAHTGERTAKEAEVGGGRWWKKGAKGRRRLICQAFNSKIRLFFQKLLKEKRVSGLCHRVKWHLVESLPGGREEVAEAAEHAREQGGGEGKGGRGRESVGVTDERI